MPLEARAGLGGGANLHLTLEVKDAEPGLGLNTETGCFWGLELKGKTERGKGCRPAVIPRSRAAPRAFAVVLHFLPSRWKYGRNVQKGMRMRG